MSIFGYESYEDYGFKYRDRVKVICYEPNRNLLGTVIGTSVSRFDHQPEVVVELDDPPEGWAKIWNMPLRWVEHIADKENNHA